MSGSTPARPVRLALSFAPEGGAWPRSPVVLLGQALRVYLRGWDVAGVELAAEGLADVEIRVARPDGVVLETELGDGHGIGAWSAGVANDLVGLWRAEATIGAPSPAVAEIAWRVQARGIAPGPADPGGVGLVAEDGLLLAAWRVEGLESLEPAEDDDRLLAFRGAVPGTVTWEVLRDAAADAGTAAGTTAGTTAGGAAGAAAASPFAAAAAASAAEANVAAIGGVGRFETRAAMDATTPEMVGALAEVWAGADAGVYRWSGSVWERFSDQTIGGLLDRNLSYDINDADAPAYLFTAPDGDGVDRKLGAIETDGTAVFPAARLGGLVVDVPPYAQFEAYETTAGFGNYVLVVSADGFIIGLIPTSEPTTDPGGEQPSTVPEDDIRRFAPAILLDGTTDESAALMAAVQAAAETGLDTLCIEGPIRASAATGLGNVHLRTRTGRGRFVPPLPYRKRVIPFNVPAPSPLLDLVPELHLARFNAAVDAASPSDPVVVTYMSDSWGNANQLIGEHSQFEYLLTRALRRQFGPRADRILVVNRGIGSQRWEDAAGTPNTFPTWYTNTSLPWLDYVTTVSDPRLPAPKAPSLVLVMLGQNHDNLPSALVVESMATVLNTLTGIPNCDVVLLTNTTPSSMAVGYGERSRQEGRTVMAGLIRAEAAFRGLGLIDLGRLLDCAHWGTDYRLTTFRRVLPASTAITLPYTWPEETTDFAIHIEGGGASTFWTTGDGALTVPLSPIVGNILVLDRDAGSGNVAYRVDTRTGIACIPRTVSTVPGVTSGITPNLAISVQGPEVLARFGNQVVCNIVVRRGGGLFTPSIGFGGGTVNVTGLKIAVADPTLVAPSLTDLQLWGSATDGSGTGGGNSLNHLSEFGRAAVFASALLGTRFAR